MDCKLMLRDAFAHAKRGKVIQKSHDFPNYYAVYVTVTLHESADAADKMHDTVWYANGQLEIAREENEERLKGTLPVWINNVQVVAAPQTPAFPLLVGKPDIFPYDDRQTLIVSINASGFVSIQRTLNNRNFLGRPPVKFQATCTNGLLTAVVDSTSYTLSLTLGVRSSRS